MEPLHIEDNVDDLDSIVDTKRTIRIGNVDDLNDYDNDDNDNDHNVTKDGDDTDHEVDDTENDETDNDYDTDDGNGNEHDVYDTKSHHCDSGNNDDDTPLRTYDEEGPQDLGPYVDTKHLISNDSNENTIMNRIFVPDVTFTPPPPQVKGDRPLPLRFGHKDDFVNYVTTSPFLRTPEAIQRMSSTKSPPFYRLAPAYLQPGKSEEQFANRMLKKWESIRGRIRDVRRGSKDVVLNYGTVIRPAKLRRIMEES